MFVSHHMRLRHHTKCVAFVRRLRRTWPQHHISSTLNTCAVGSYTFTRVAVVVECRRQISILNYGRIERFLLFGEQRIREEPCDRSVVVDLSTAPHIPRVYWKLNGGVLALFGDDAMKLCRFSRVRCGAQ